MRNFNRSDELHLQAAVGWLELGNWREANEELENVSPEQRAHPDVLQVRCKIYGDAQRWEYVAEVANTLCTMLPDSAFGPLHLAHALRQLDRAKEARDALLPIADKFPDDWRIPFQIACYCCKAGELPAVMSWLGRAIDLAGKVDIRTRVLDESDSNVLAGYIGDLSAPGLIKGSS